MFGKFDFDADKPYIADEYADAHFDPASGADAATLAKMLDDLIADGDARSLPMLTLRAESFRLLVENAQIEVAPHTPFADKINAGDRLYRLGGLVGLREDLEAQIGQKIQHRHPRGLAGQKMGL